MVLLGGFAPFENSDISLRGLQTKFGRCDITRKNGVVSNGVVSIEWERELPKGVKVMISECHGIEPKDRRWKNENGNEIWISETPMRVLICQ